MMNISPVRIAKPSVGAPRFAAGQAKADVSDRFIDVSGIGTVSKTPDILRMTVSLSQQATGKDGRTKVTSALNTKAQAVKAAIEDLKLPVKLQSSMNVTRWFEYNNQRNKQEFKGFQGNYSLSVTAEKKPLAELKEIAAKLTDLSVQHDLDFGDPNFDYSDRKGAAIEAIKGAALAITETVAAVAEAFGLKVSEKPAQLSLGDSQNYNRPHAMRASLALESADGGGMSADVIETANVQVSSPQINARYEIEGAAPAKKPTAKKA